MEENYLRLLRLYKKSPQKFQKVIEEIGVENFDLNTVLQFLDSGDSGISEGTRRILLTCFHKELTNSELYSFKACSGDSVTQKMIENILEERVIQKEGLRAEAASLIALFRS